MNDVHIDVSLEDHFWQLGLAAGVGSKQTRRAGSRSTCKECGEIVDVVEDKVPMLTSSGTVYVWKRRRVYAHRRSCWEAVDERIRRQIEANPVDLWARD